MTCTEDSKFDPNILALEKGVSQDAPIKRRSPGGRDESLPEVDRWLQKLT